MEKEEEGLCEAERIDFEFQLLPLACFQKLHIVALSIFTVYFDSMLKSFTINSIFNYLDITGSVNLVTGIGS